MVLIRSQDGVSLYVILKRALRELRGPQRLLPPLEDEHLEHA